MKTKTYYKLKTLAYFAICAFLLLSFSNPGPVGDDCNLLEAYAEPIKNLEFVKCENGEGQHIKSATYRVKGEHALEVEKCIVKKYGMAKLRFVCCAWEPERGRDGTIENPKIKQLNKDYHLSITMYGNAEKKAENGSYYIEKDRNKIDYFYVLVELLDI